MPTPYLQIENLTKSFGDKVLFEGLSFGIAEGQRIALIARNGIGKSTLLDIIAGHEACSRLSTAVCKHLVEADAGTITFRNDLRVGYLSQQTDYNPTLTIEETMKKYLSDDIDNDASEHWETFPPSGGIRGGLEFLTRLGITNLQQPMGQLSGGQRKRVALALVLASQPDLLILDEPTNHLDLEMVEWLEQYLRKPNITLLLVTHDRYFLDRVCTDIIEIDNQQLYTYHGNYAYYLEKRAERLETQQAEIDKARNLYRTELEWMRRMPQARGHKAQYRVDAFAGLEAKAKQQITNDTIRLEVKSTYIGSKIFEAKNVCKAFAPNTSEHGQVSPLHGGTEGGLVILDNFSYVFSRYEKVGIIGNNGTGKTTFLKLLLGIEQPDSGCFDIGQTVRFGYYRQEGAFTTSRDANRTQSVGRLPQRPSSRDSIYGVSSEQQCSRDSIYDVSSEHGQSSFVEGRKVIDLVRDKAEFIDLGDGKRLSASQFLQHFLFSPSQQYDYVEKLSGGEKQRLHLCMVLMQNPNFLILDEPTNDLDIPTLAILEEYLRAFKGCLIVVSHDRYFMDKVVDHLFVFKGAGEIQDFPGNYTQWRNEEGAKTKAVEGAKATNEPKRTASSERRMTQVRKLTFKEKQELAQLEQDMPQLEAEKAALETQLSGGLSNPDEIAQASRRYEEVTNLLDEKEMRWLELSDITNNP